MTEEFWKEHERRLREAQDARRSRQRRIHERDLEIFRIEATEAVILHAIDGLCSLAKPIVKPQTPSQEATEENRTGAVEVHQASQGEDSLASFAFSHVRTLQLCLCHLSLSQTEEGEERNAYCFLVERLLTIEGWLPCSRDSSLR